MDIYKLLNNLFGDANFFVIICLTVIIVFITMFAFGTIVGTLYDFAGRIINNGQNDVNNDVNLSEENEEVIAKTPENDVSLIDTDYEKILQDNVIAEQNRNNSINTDGFPVEEILGNNTCIPKENISTNILTNESTKLQNIIQISNREEQTLDNANIKSKTNKLEALSNDVTLKNEITELLNYQDNIEITELMDYQHNILDGDYFNDDPISAQHKVGNGDFDIVPLTSIPDFNVFELIEEAEITSNEVMNVDSVNEIDFIVTENLITDAENVNHKENMNLAFEKVQEETNAELKCSLVNLEDTAQYNTKSSSSDSKLIHDVSKILKDEPRIDVESESNVNILNDEIQEVQCTELDSHTDDLIKTGNDKTSRLNVDMSLIKSYPMVKKNIINLNSENKNDRLIEQNSSNCLITNEALTLHNSYSNTIKNVQSLTENFYQIETTTDQRGIEQKCINNQTEDIDNKKNTETYRIKNINELLQDNSITVGINNANSSLKDVINSQVLVEHHRTQNELSCEKLSESKKPLWYVDNSNDSISENNNKVEKLNIANMGNILSRLFGDVVDIEMGKLGMSSTDNITISEDGEYAIIDFEGEEYKVNKKKLKELENKDKIRNSRNLQELFQKLEDLDVVDRMNKKDIYHVDQNNENKTVNDKNETQADNNDQMYSINISCGPTTSTDDLKNVDILKEKEKEVINTKQTEEKINKTVLELQDNLNEVNVNKDVKTIDVTQVQSDNKLLNEFTHTQTKLYDVNENITVNIGNLNVKQENNENNKKSTQADQTINKSNKQTSTKLKNNEFNLEQESSEKKLESISQNLLAHINKQTESNFLTGINTVEENDNRTEIKSEHQTTLSLSESLSSNEQLKSSSSTTQTKAITNIEIETIDETCIKTEIINQTETDLIPIVNQTQTEFIPIVDQTQTELIPTVNQTQTKTDLIPNVNPTETELIPIVNQTQTELIPIVVQTETDLIPTVDQTQTKLTPIVVQTKTDLIPNVDPTETELIPIVNQTQTELIPIVVQTETDLIPTVDQTQTELIPIVVQTETDLIPTVDQTQTELIQTVNQIESDLIQTVDQNNTELIPDVDQANIELIPIVDPTQTELIPSSEINDKSSTAESRNNIQEEMDKNSTTTDEHQKVNKPIKGKRKQKILELRLELFEPVTDKKAQSTETREISNKPLPTNANIVNEPHFEVNKTKNPLVPSKVDFPDKPRVETTQTPYIELTKTNVTNEPRIEIIEAMVTNEPPIEISDSDVINEPRIESNETDFINEPGIETIEIIVTNESPIEANKTDVVNEPRIETIETITTNESPIESNETNVINEPRIETIETIVTNKSPIEANEADVMNESRIETIETIATNKSLIESNETNAINESRIETIETIVTNKSPIEANEADVMNEPRIETIETIATNESPIESNETNVINEPRIETIETIVINESPIKADEADVMNEPRIKTIETIATNESLIESNETNVLNEPRIETIETFVTNESPVESTDTDVTNKPRIETIETFVTNESPVESTDTDVTNEPRIETIETFVTNESQVKSNETDVTNKPRIETIVTNESSIELNDTDVINEPRIETVETMVANECLIESNDTDVINEPRIETVETNECLIESNDTEFINQPRIETIETMVTIEPQFKSTEANVKNVPLIEATKTIVTNELSIESNGANENYIEANEIGVTNENHIKATETNVISKPYNYDEVKDEPTTEFADINDEIRNQETISTSVADKIHIAAEPELAEENTLSSISNSNHNVKTIMFNHKRDMKDDDFTTSHPIAKSKQYDILTPTLSSENVNNNSVISDFDFSPDKITFTSPQYHFISYQQKSKSLTNLRHADEKVILKRKMGNPKRTDFKSDLILHKCKSMEIKRKKSKVSLSTKVRSKNHRSKETNLDDITNKMTQNTKLDTDIFSSMPSIFDQNDFKLHSSFETDIDMALNEPQPYLQKWDSFSNTSFDSAIINIATSNNKQSTLGTSKLVEDIFIVSPLTSPDSSNIENAFGDDFVPASPKTYAKKYTSSEVQNDLKSNLFPDNDFTGTIHVDEEIITQDTIADVNKSCFSETYFDDNFVDKNELFPPKLSVELLQKEIENHTLRLEIEKEEFLSATKTLTHIENKNIIKVEKYSPQKEEEANSYNKNVFEVNEPVFTEKRFSSDFEIDLSFNNTGIEQDENLSHKSHVVENCNNNNEDIDNNKILGNNKLEKENENLENIETKLIESSKTNEYENKDIEIVKVDLKKKPNTEIEQNKDFLSSTDEVKKEETTMRIMPNICLDTPGKTLKRNSADYMMQDSSLTYEDALTILDSTVDGEIKIADIKNRDKLETSDIKKQEKLETPDRKRHHNEFNSDSECDKKSHQKIRNLKKKNKHSPLMGVKSMPTTPILQNKRKAHLTLIKSSSWQYSSDYALTKTSRSLIESIEDEMEKDYSDDEENEIKMAIEKLRPVQQKQSETNAIIIPNKYSNKKQQQRFPSENSLATRPRHLRPSTFDKDKRLSKSLHDIFTGKSIETDIDDIDEMELNDALQSPEYQQSTPDIFETDVDQINHRNNKQTLSLGNISQINTKSSIAKSPSTERRYIVVSKKSGKMKNRIGSTNSNESVNSVDNTSKFFFKSAESIVRQRNSSSDDNSNLASLQSYNDHLNKQESNTFIENNELLIKNKESIINKNVNETKIKIAEKIIPKNVSSQSSQPNKILISNPKNKRDSWDVFDTDKHSRYKLNKINSSPSKRDSWDIFEKQTQSFKRQDSNEIEKGIITRRAVSSDAQTKHKSWNILELMNASNDPNNNNKSYNRNSSDIGYLFEKYQTERDALKKLQNKQKRRSSCCSEFSEISSLSDGSTTSRDEASWLNDVMDIVIPEHGISKEVKRLSAFRPIDTATDEQVKTFHSYTDLASESLSPKTPTSPIEFAETVTFPSPTKPKFTPEMIDFNDDDLSNMVLAKAASAVRSRRRSNRRRNTSEESTLDADQSDKLKVTNLQVVNEAKTSDSGISDGSTHLSPKDERKAAMKSNSPSDFLPQQEQCSSPRSTDKQNSESIGSNISTNSKKSKSIRSRINKSFKHASAFLYPSTSEQNKKVETSRSYEHISSLPNLYFENKSTKFSSEDLDFYDTEDFQSESSLLSDSCFDQFEGSVFDDELFIYPSLHLHKTNNQNRHMSVNSESSEEESFDNFGTKTPINESFTENNIEIERTVTCGYPPCSKQQIMKGQERSSFTSCPSCFTCYCSRACRRKHWHEHKRICFFGRISYYIRSMIRRCEKEKKLNEYLKFMASENYNSYGRGCLTITFETPTDAKIALVSKNTVLNTKPTYSNIETIRNDNNRHTHLLHQTLKDYDPEQEFIVNISIVISSKTRKAKKASTVVRCARVSMITPLVSLYDNISQSYVIRTFTLPILDDNFNDRETRRYYCRELSFSLKRCGVRLKNEYNDCYEKLCAYVENERMFQPLVLYGKKDGRNFKCIIYPSDMHHTSEERGEGVMV